MKVKSAFRVLMAYRTHPKRVVRCAWWTSLGGMAGLCLAPHIVGPVIAGIWLALNIVLLAVSVVWGLFHLRTALRHSRQTLLWSFWNTVVALPLMYWFMDTALATAGVRLSTLEAVAVTGLIVSPTIFVMQLAIGFAGQCVSARAARNAPNADHVSRVGTLSWWALYTGTYAIQTASTILSVRHAALLVILAVFSGLPTMTLLSCRLAMNPHTDPEAFLRERFAILARRLVIYRLRNGRRTVIDLRGATIGLLTSSIILALGSNQFLWLLQGAGLVSLTQLYNSEPKLTAHLARPNGTLAAERDRMIIVDFDPISRRLALSTRSEAAVQSDAVRKLKTWGARSIVLLAPWEHLIETIPSPGTPLPTEADRSRSRRDLPLLARSIRAAGNVVFAAPSIQLQEMQSDPSTKLAELVRSAVATGPEDISSFGTSQLPALLFATDQQFGLPMPPQNFTPVPFTVAALDRGKQPTITFDFYQPDHALFAGKRIPLIPPGVMAIDFHSDRQGRDFRHVTYHDLLNDEPLYVTSAPPPARAGTNRRRATPTSQSGTWVMPPQLFAGKIVFLNSISSPMRDTPLGTLSQCEVLAYATATLLSGSSPQAFHPVLSALIVLALGAGIGQLGGRRTPLSAGFQAAAIAVGIGIASVVVFLTSGAQWWLDPVVPILAVGAAYVAVTQFAFGRERHERERNRDLLRRFVAPQVVEELLDAPEEQLGLGGSRRLVCVLFADVRNFTPFSERHSPEQVIEVVNEYMTALTDVLYAYEGILDKYTGDGLMATFRVGGSPRNDVCRAVQAVTAMRDRAMEVSAARQERGIPSLSLGFGLHYGEAVVGLVGNPNRFEYTALGHTVVIAARLQTLAAGGEVVVSDAVFAAVEGAFTMLPGEPVYVKGMEHPVHPYRITPAIAPGSPTPELLPTP